MTLIRQYYDFFMTFLGVVRRTGEPRDTDRAGRR
uniref:Uncharacterized protein n=1 Tax=mine drainage metagenome TaxID=410659 RepID=E6QC62_9ZZZZ